MRRTLELREALSRYQTEGEAGFAAFATRSRRYITASWAHVGTEERELLSLARQKRTQRDWASINAAFEANKDPWSGPTGEFKALFSRIVTMVPSPMGLGPA